VLRAIALVVGFVVALALVPLLIEVSVWLTFAIALALLVLAAYFRAVQEDGEQDAAVQRRWFARQPARRGAQESGLTLSRCVQCVRTVPPSSCICAPTAT
jgi:membrane protein implicated in regulation of membrane protease activity